MSRTAAQLQSLLNEVRACTLCQGSIPEPNPVLRAHQAARLLVIGQAPGTRVHTSGIPWHDASGTRLRQWLALSDADFYDTSKVAIIPMGFCYPGKGKSGDLPPRPECAQTWHARLLRQLPNIECTLLIGQYAQRYYLPATRLPLTERVRNWRHYTPDYFVLPHPSPRNQLWLRRNPWFENELVPQLQARIQTIFAGACAT